MRDDQERPATPYSPEFDLVDDPVAEAASPAVESNTHAPNHLDSTAGIPLFETFDDHTSSAPPEAINQVLPPPMQGCLYCHSVGTIQRADSRPILGLVGGGAILTCSACGAVASFAAGTDPDQWRINYRKYNRSSRFYYVMVHLGLAGWLEADHALDISRKGFVQRHRLGQAQRGDLGWLYPHKLEPPPPLMSPSETVYSTFNPASLYQSAKGGRTASILARGEGTLLDTGKLYVTDLKIHLRGKGRDWSHRLSEIGKVDHTDRHWRVYVGEGGQYYQGENLDGQLDAQLFSVVLQYLGGRR